ncbi:ras and EF-hand domain-containing -like protein [Labeo rohita]|uniref:Ras and EF-hand domain-containing-like protein n=1 Tax=Labeo rohita TaxID=84645 RepID=A0A498L8W9_LABRO|nr:ras and EF-hand domain-containing -like protein [Labeo rohita]
MPLTTEELENVFDSLDPDKNGYLTLGEFSSGFSKFIISLQKEGLENETFPSPSEVRSLWAQLRNDEPHLLSDFEEFLAHEARQERKEMESALGRKAATHDTEICRLYEETSLMKKIEQF